MEKVTSLKARFRIKGWLDNDTYGELLNFSNYLGRYQGTSIFEINEEKMRLNGYSPIDVIEKLRDLERNAFVEDIKAIENHFKENLSIKIDYDGKHILLSSKVYLKQYLSDFYAKGKYDSSKKSYIFEPYLYVDLKKYLMSRGFIIEDRTNIFLNSKLPRELSFNGILRDYQEEAVKKWSENGKGVIVLPTGSGKTIIAIRAIAKLGVNTLIVVYTKEHIKQWSNAIKKFTDAGSLVGEFYGEDKNIRPITVTTYQSAFRNVTIFSRKFKFLIFDEAHHLPAEKFKAIAIGMPSPFRMGLSAIAVREDGKENEIFPLIGGIVYQKSPGELSEKGYLAPYIIRRVRVDLNKEDMKKYDELKKQYIVFSKGRRFDEILEAAKRGDRNAINALRLKAQMQHIVQNSEAKINKVIEIAKNELSRGSKIIIFTQYKEQAETIANKLGAFLIHGGIEEKMRINALEGFKNAKSAILVITTVGDEGLDIPDANIGIFVSGTGSRRQFIQRLGRLLRPMPGKKSILYEIVASRTSEEAQSRKRRNAL